MNTRHLFSVAVSLVLLAGAAPPAGADVDLAAQRDQQRRIQEDTDRLVRRLETMVRVLNFYGIAGNAQKETIEEMAATLQGLSRQQMTEVIRRLDAAAQTDDEAKSDGELDQAYA